MILILKLLTIYFLLYLPNLMYLKILLTPYLLDLDLNLHCFDQYSLRVIILYLHLKRFRYLILHLSLKQLPVENKAFNHHFMNYFRVK